MFGTRAGVRDSYGTGMGLVHGTRTGRERLGGPAGRRPGRGHGMWQAEEGLTVVQQQRTSQEAAMDVGATAEGYRRRQRRRRLTVAAPWVIAAALSTGIAVLPADPDPYIGLQVMPEIILLLIAPVQLLGLACGRRERRILESYGWEAYPCEVRVRSRHVEVRLQLGPGDELVLTPQMLRQEPGIANSKHPDQAWFCGDRRYGGVVSPVGGGRPVRCVRDKRSKKDKKRPEPFAGADELAVRSGVLGTAY